MKKGVITVIGAGMCYMLFGSWQALPDMLSRRLQSLAQEHTYAGKALVLSLPKNTKVLIINTVEDNLTTLIGKLGSQSVLIFNGNMIKSEPTRPIIELITQHLRANPTRAFYLLGTTERTRVTEHPADSSYELALQSFLETLPRGIYLLGEDLQEAPLLIAPNTGTFNSIACSPLAHKEPIKALCTIGGLCSFEEGTLSATIVGAQEQKNIIITMGSTIADSSITRVTV